MGERSRPASMAAARGAYNPRRDERRARGRPGVHTRVVRAREFRPGGSKSLAQRALLCAAVATARPSSPASRTPRTCAPPPSWSLAWASLRASDPARVRIDGAPPGPDAGLAPRGALAVGESGTLARLATAWWRSPAVRSSAGRRGARLAALPQEPGAVPDAARGGVELVRQNLPGTWPVELVSCAPPAELELVRPASSQEVSGSCWRSPRTRGARSCACAGASRANPTCA
jgi:5-enolpyruvylshikimate-3-phosphate synthase